MRQIEPSYIGSLLINPASFTILIGMVSSINASSLLPRVKIFPSGDSATEFSGIQQFSLMSHALKEFDFPLVNV